MSAVDSLLDPVPVPKIVKVRQIFERPKVENVEEEVARKLRDSGALNAVKPGWKVAITGGSRGISNMPLVLRTVAEMVKNAGGEPFVFPAMGSHGGASAEGQRHVLENLGITEDRLGVPIRATMETVELGLSENGRPVYLDKYANEADAIVVVNRIKPHVAFRGPYESGIMKMITIGMGKQKGADYAHMLGFGKMAENVPSIAKVVIAKKNILCAVGLLENAFHETAEIVVMKASEIESREPLLLKKAWTLYPKLYFDKLDVLVIDEIGKDISGTGFDTNVVGRYHTPFASGGPEITRAVVLDITDRSGGNANGLGIVDFTTQRAYRKFDFEQTYPNSLTSTVPLSVKIPMVLKNDRQAIQAAIKTSNVLDRTKITLARIKNTTALGEIEASESLLDYIREHPKLEAEGGAREFEFDQSGNLF
ncbi:MAG: lactate racemase domain-containing protein [Synergistaceae bacterium]|nr:lactate racemase domain-containing protein [Synergistaceae bacterium]